VTELKRTAGKNEIAGDPARPVIGSTRVICGAT